MKKAFLGLLAVLFFMELNAQQEVADSLVILANETTGIERADILNDAANAILNYDPEKGIEYAREALEICLAEDETEEAYFSMLLIGNAHYAMGNYEKVLEVDLETLEKFGNKINKKKLAQLHNQIGNDYFSLHNHEKAIQHLLEAIKILEPFTKAGDEFAAHTMYAVRINTGSVFSYLDNSPKALEQFHFALNIGRQLKDSTKIYSAYNNIGAVYQQMQEYRQALDNFLAALDIIKSSGSTHDAATIHVNIGDIYLLTDSLNSALHHIEKGHELAAALGNDYLSAKASGSLGRVYLKKHMPLKALPHIEGAEVIAKENQYPEVLRQINRLFADYYLMTGDYRKAYEAQKEFISINDSLTNVELTSEITEIQTRYETEKKEQEIELLTKNAEIKDLKLRRQQDLLFSLGGVLLLLAVVGILWYRSSRQKQKLVKSEMDKRNLLTEQKLLRAQINPHFMFNALNSVQSYISANDTLKAMTYLAKFSQLMRNILENSRKSMITLEEEVNTLKLYMELEAMRFSNSFEYRVKIQENLVPSRIYIPPMLVQPFVENSIKHGFRDRQTAGRVMVEFSKNNGMVSCTIEDNGMGREKAMAMKTAGKSAHKSLGMQVTHERLIAMKKDRNLNVTFNIEDLVSADGKPAGTRVLLDMPYETE